MNGPNWFIDTMYSALKEAMIDKNITLSEERIEQIMSDALANSLPKTAEILLKSLKTNFGKMIEEHRLIRQESEARLLRRWSKPLNLLEALTVMSLESAELFVER